MIWRSGRSLVLYRGMTYELPCVQSYSKLVTTKSDSYLMTSSANPSEGSTDTSDIDSLLDQLGPRFTDWSGRNPLPVDADLLHSVVPGYKPPFRLLPYKTRNSLREGEMTFLRRLARKMLPHFALGMIIKSLTKRLQHNLSLFLLLTCHTICPCCRKKQATPRVSYCYYGQIMGEKCYCKDSHQAWCTKYM